MGTGCRTVDMDASRASRSRARARERAACRSLALCIVAFASLAASASIALWIGDEDNALGDATKDEFGLRRWIWQSAILVTAVCALVCAWMTRASDPGIVVPTADDDRAAACVKRLHEATRVKAEATSEESKSGDKCPSYSDRLRQCVIDAVEEDAEARSWGMDRDFGGAWTRRALTETSATSDDARLKFCVTCQLWRPPMATHCATCNVCVRRFDHHCGVIGNCVGEYNHSWFLALLTSGAAMGVLIFIVAAYSLAKMSKNAWRSTAWPYMLLACALSGAHVIGFVCFAWTHWVMFVLDITTKAWIKREAGATGADVRRQFGLHRSMYERCCHVPLRSRSTAMREFLERRREPIDAVAACA